MWNHIREKTSSNEFPSYYVGEYLFASFYNFPPYIWWSMRKLSYSYITSKMDILNYVLFCSTFVVIGMEASGGMFTSFLGRRDLYHHMMMPINILTVMQMLTRFVAFKLQFYFTILVPWYLLGHSFPKQIKLINYYIFLCLFLF